MQSSTPDATSPPTAQPVFYLVAGVAPGDTLNVRQGPAARFAIVARLSNGVSGIRITSAPVLNDTTEWVKIVVEDTTGWVNRQYLQSE